MVDVFTDHILDFLLSPSGASAFALARELDPSRPSDLTKLRNQCTVDEVRAVFELIDLRRRARAKFSRADQMFFDRVALEQSSGQIVAEYKADRLMRFDQTGPVYDLCCGIGGDSIGFTRYGETVAIDSSPLRIRMARLNLRAYGREERCQLICSDINTINIAGGVFHLDPDRRREGRRSVRLEDIRPDTSFIDGLLAKTATGVIKLAPAVDYEHLPWPGELEMVSFRGECKQLLLWTGELAQTKLKATVLPEAVTITDAGQCGYDVGPIGRFLYDPDPALTRLRLLGQLAAELDLKFLWPGQVVLTADHYTESPLAKGFEVEQVLGFHLAKLSKLRKHLRSNQIGEVVIKPRGLKVDVDRIAKVLSGKDGPARVIFLLRLGKRVKAVIAKGMKLGSGRKMGSGQ